MGFVTVPMEKPSGESLAPTKHGRVPAASSSAPATTQVITLPRCRPSSMPILIRTVDTNFNLGPGLQKDNDEQITQCPDGSYCCGADALGRNCCDKGLGVLVKDGTTQAAHPTSTPASSPSSQPPKTTNASSDPSSDTSPPKSNLGAGAIAGIVVGALAGILFLAALWFLLSRRRKAKRRATKEMASEKGASPTSMYGDPIVTGLQEAPSSHPEDYGRSELQARPVSWTMGRSELGDEQSHVERSELDGKDTSAPNLPYPT
ncbi:MAG: hypothetical protein Q9168_006522 [Polycauliona sp. 1 TL-2023]